MIKVTAKVTGGTLADYEMEDGDTVRELRKKLNLTKEYAATVKGEPEDDEYELKEFDYVTFAPAVKGGQPAL